MATRGSNRRALGDITSQQSNQPIAVTDKVKVISPWTLSFLQVAAKPRLTKQASRRLSKPAPVPEVEEMEVEAKLERWVEFVCEWIEACWQTILPCPPRAFPPGVEDVDSRDDDNPLMCSEYAFEVALLLLLLLFVLVLLLLICLGQIFSYLRNLESKSAVKAGHLQGCPTNDKVETC